MENKNIIIIGIGSFIAIIGVIFLVLPHELHNQILSTLTGETTEHHHEHQEHGTHDIHQVIGVIITIIGLIITVVGWKVIK